MAQIDALKNRKKRKIYTKHSKRTQKCHKNETIALVSKGFHPLEKHGFTVKHCNKMDHIVEGLPEESEEAFDEANGPTQDPCVYCKTCDVRTYVTVSYSIFIIITTNLYISDS